MFDPVPLVTFALCGTAVSVSLVPCPLPAHVPQLLNALHEFKTGVRRTVKFEEAQYKVTYESLLKNLARLSTSTRFKVDFLEFREQLFTQGQ